MKKKTTHTGPAANTPYQDPGFNPMKYARKTVNEAGDTLMELELPHKRLWFRQACPDGSMLLNALRITDQLAIFEAKVFFSKEDPLPASSFVASKTAKESPKYIRNAQDEALSAALDNAGFGIHLYGVPSACKQTGPAPDPKPEPEPDPKPEPAPDPKPEPAPDPKPEPALDPKPEPAPDPKPESAPDPKPESAPNPKPGPAPDPKLESAPDPKLEPAPDPKLEPAPDQKPEPVPESKTEPAPKLTPDTRVKSVTDELASILNFPVPENEPAQKQKNPPEQTDGGMTGPAEEAMETPAGSQPSYTDDTPVEEICQRMTLGEARSIVLKTGINKGSTLGEVEIKCPSSLYYYIAPHSKCGNIQKAGATLVLQEMGAVRQSEEKRTKAG